jgi:hypothetical protein
MVERRAEILRKALETRDLRRLFSTPSLMVVLGEREDGIIGALHLSETHFPRGKVPPRVLRNSALVQLDSDWYAAVERQIKVWTSRDEVNQATLRRFGTRWVRNGMRNLEAIRDLPGIKRLKGMVPSHIPAFLAAAGPSLDRIAPLLPAIHQRCVIVAVDTALRCFVQAGVAPDFAVVVDPQYWNFRHLDRVSLPTTRFIVESAVYPPVLRHPCGGKFLCASLYPLGSFIEERLDPKGRLGAGGSVATTAWDFAGLLGSASIWIAGLDLAFPGLKTHFKGARFEEQVFSESTRFSPGETRSFRALRDGNPFWASAADGSRVLTDRRLSLYAAWFENRFNGTPGLKNYRLSGEGLALSGCVEADEADLLALPIQREEIDLLLRRAFAQVQQDFMGSKQRRRRQEHYHRALQELVQGLTRLQSLTRTAAMLLREKCAVERPEAEKTLLCNHLEVLDREIAASPVKDVAAFLAPLPIQSDGTVNRYEALSDAAARQLRLLGEE